MNKRGREVTKAIPMTDAMTSDSDVRHQVKSIVITALPLTSNGTYACDITHEMLGTIPFFTAKPTSRSKRSRGAQS